MRKTALSFTVLTVLFAGFTARADDKSADAKLQQAIALYKQRTDPAKVTEALALCQAAKGEATDQDLKYEILTLHARVLYWKGMHTTGDANKILIHQEGVDRSQEARTLVPDYAEAFYWGAAHMGRWAEAKGIIASLSKKQEIMDTLEAIFELNTKAGDAGETWEGYGADRILGRLYFKLPSFAGGNLATSLKHLEQAYTKGPQIALNTVFYAESLASGTSAQKAKAKQILDDLLAKDPNTLNPDRIPETLEEFKDARKLRAELGSR
jgi:hypothetical protein